MSLAVISSHFNPNGFHNPRRNLLRFMRQMTAAGIPVYVAEMAYEGQPFCLPASRFVSHYRIDTSHIMWHKENLLNVLANRVPSQYDKLAWIDPDIMFLSNDWYLRAEEALNTRAAVQLFSVASWTNRDGQIYRSQNSTMHDKALKIGVNHPGFAWAARRGLWSKGGGLCDLAILGGGDALFAASCLGCEIPEWLFYPQWRSWTNRLASWVWAEGGCDYITGHIVHEWHGSDNRRSYVDRHKILSGIDISQVVARREDGIIQFTDDASEHLRTEMRNYFAERREDGSG